MAIKVLDKTATLDQAKKRGMSDEEFFKITTILGRSPNYTEMCIYSVLWSENYSYKNTKKWIKSLPKNGQNILLNKGDTRTNYIDLEDGLACVLKIGSTPYITTDPYHDAATSIGRVNKKVFATGARPLAQLNSLRFGELKNENTKYLLENIVKGIGDYGNSIGIPFVGSELSFHPPLEKQPAISILSAGIIDSESIIPRVANDIGNIVYMVSSTTEIERIRPEQSGMPSNPFKGKSLMEASLEIAKSEALIDMQSIGKGGIAGATSKLIRSEEIGMDIYLEKIPLPQQEVELSELILSESLERMLFVIKKGKEKLFTNIINRWNLQFEHIGEVTKGGSLRFIRKNIVLAEIPIHSIGIEGVSKNDLDYKKPAYFQEEKRFSIEQIDEPNDLVVVARKMLANPNIASKRWVTEQYDNMVGTVNMSHNCPSDAAILNIKGANKAIVLTMNCNVRYVQADPEIGTAIAVAKAARNIICSGGEPTAITNIIHIGNPNTPEVYWKFVGAIKGMRNACLKFDTAVTGGSVSHFDQSLDDLENNKSPYLIPTIGMMGLLRDKSLQTSMDFKYKGDLIFLIGESKNDINSSEYLASIHGIENSPTPFFDIDQEHLVQDTVRQLIKNNYINSAHEVSDGGIFIALFEMGAPRNLGFDIVTDSDVREDAFLFGEAQSRVLVTVIDDYQDEFIDITSKMGVEVTLLGHVTQGKMMVDDKHFGFISGAKEIFETSLEDEMSR